jgi:hypothetical protein
VSDDEKTGIEHLFTDGALDTLVGGAVERGRRLVENEDGGGAELEDATSEGEELALT